jgi:hypothetical protein
MSEIHLRPYTSYEERTRFALAFANLYDQYNPNFDRMRFLKACHLAGETIREVA